MTRPDEVEGRRKVDIRTRLDEIIELGSRYHFRQNRCGCQQRFGFVFAINPAIAILHHWPPLRGLSGAQHGHTEEGVEGLLAGLGAIGESRVFRGILGSATSLCGNQSHQALAEAKGGHVADSGLRPCVANSSSAPSSRSTSTRRRTSTRMFDGDQVDDLVQAGPAASSSAMTSRNCRSKTRGPPVAVAIGNQAGDPSPSRTRRALPGVGFDAGAAACSRRPACRVRNTYGAPGPQARLWSSISTGS